MVWDVFQSSILTEKSIIDVFLFTFVVHEVNFIALTVFIFLNFCGIVLRFILQFLEVLTSMFLHTENLFC